MVMVVVLMVIMLVMMMTITVATASAKHNCFTARMWWWWWWWWLPHVLFVAAFLLPSRCVCRESTSARPKRARFLIDFSRCIIPHLFSACHPTALDKNQPKKEAKLALFFVSYAATFLLFFSSWLNLFFCFSGCHTSLF